MNLFKQKSPYPIDPSWWEKAETISYDILPKDIKRLFIKKRQHERFIGFLFCIPACFIMLTIITLVMLNLGNIRTVILPCSMLFIGAVIFTYYAAYNGHISIASDIAMLELGGKHKTELKAAKILVTAVYDKAYEVKNKEKIKYFAEIAGKAYEIPEIGFNNLNETMPAECILIMMKAPGSEVSILDLIQLTKSASK